MGLFGTKRITIEKTMNKDNVQFIIDYSKIKKPGDFLEGLILCFTEESHSFMVIDSNNFYTNSRSERKDKIQEIKTKLDNQELNYKELIIQEDNEYTLLGLKLNNDKKVNSYKIGINVVPGSLKGILVAVSDNNACCYIISKEMQPDECMNKFIEAKGDYETLSRVFGISLYFDMSFQRIRVLTNEEDAKSMEQKLQDYTDTYRADRK